VVCVAQILNILENFNLKKMGAGSADFMHVVAEAMKLAFADRAYWLGDPDFAPVPRGLVSKPYAAELARRIDPKRATPVSRAQTPPDAANDVFGKHTTHFSTADDSGNWVACTATINTTFGSKVVIPGTGVLMNNEMDDFAIQPVWRTTSAWWARRRTPGTGQTPAFEHEPDDRNQGRPTHPERRRCRWADHHQPDALAIVYLIDFGMGVDEALAAPASISNGSLTNCASTRRSTQSSEQAGENGTHTRGRGLVRRSTSRGMEQEKAELRRFAGSAGQRRGWGFLNGAGSFLGRDAALAASPRRSGAEQGLRPRS
jgi:gamma-glutamyltranspeptidase